MPIISVIGETIRIFFPYLYAGPNYISFLLVITFYSSIRYLKPKLRLDIAVLGMAIAELLIVISGGNSIGAHP